MILLAFLTDTIIRKFRFSPVTVGKPKRAETKYCYHFEELQTDFQMESKQDGRLPPAYFPPFHFDKDVFFKDEALFQNFLFFHIF